MTTVPPGPQRVCFRLQVKPEAVDEYRRRHAQVWPEMRAALSASGWQNYSLFLDDDGTLVGYLECDDFTACQERMQDYEVNARWQALMAPLFDLGGAAPDAMMDPIPPVFHLA